MVAFASAWTPALSTTTRPRSALAGTAVAPARGVAATAATTMRFGVDMDKYAKMARDTLGLNAKPVDYSRPSAFWKYTTATQGARNAPTVTVHHRVASAGSFDAYMDAWRGLITRTMAPAAVPVTGVAPRGLAGARADVYMAERVRSAYKQQANPMGVYQPACTEGSAKGHADASRIAALSSRFRAGHRSTAAKLGDYFETRRRATTVAAGCTYEESLIGRFPGAAAATVLGAAEVGRTCVRYGVPRSAAETFMVRAVDAQMKARAVVGGVYAPSCSDGGAAGEAETARVTALAAAFRARAAPAGVDAAARFDSAAYARDHFGHGCDYEEALFNKWGAVAAAMRPSTARY